MKVRIYAETKSTMQSGRGRAGRVVLQPADLGPRRVEPLMGWVSSPDTLNQIRMTFPDMASATRYAQEQGWEYTVDLGAERRVKPRNYTDNFRYIPPEDDKALKKT